MSTDALKRQLRAAESGGDDARATELREQIAATGEKLPHDSRHATVGGDRTERAIAAPNSQARG